MVVRRLGDGPAVIWLHGLGEWSESFVPLARDPGLAGFGHVLVDLPGYGRSPWPEPGPGELATLAGVADHLTAWIDAQLAAPPAVIGHSMGGVLATLIAARRELAAVVDLEGNLTLGDCTQSAQAAAYTVEDFAARGMAAIRDEVYRGGATQPPLRSYHAGLCCADPRMFHAHARELVRLSTSGTLIDQLAAVRAPSLFVAGVPGGMAAPSLAQLAERGLRWIGLEPAGHWAHLDQRARFVAEVGAFLREPR